MSDDLSEIKDMSKDIGPKKVETPQVKAEQFDPITVVRAANMLSSRRMRPTFGSCDRTIAVPKTRRPGCSGTCSEE